MSLRVWLPLNGDLRNNGTADITVTNNGATVDNNGKIGKCYSFDGTDDKIILTNLPNPSNISVAFWMKRSANTGTRQFMFTAWNGVTCELTSTGVIHCYVAPSHGVCNSTNAITVDDGWVHVVYTFEDKVCGKLYINGSLVKTTTSSNSISWNTTTGNLGYFSTYFNGKLNDFRMYDHVLSAKEVKEINKGLVCHYKLDNDARGGQENLYDFQSIASKWTADGATKTDYLDSVYGNVLKINSSSGNKRIYRGVSNIWTQGQIYTVSFLAKADSNCICDMSRSVINLSPQFNLSTEWKRYSGQINCTETSAGGTLSFRVLTTGINVYITQIKLEKGEVATAYRPNINDPDYNKLGYNNTTIYDCSGYNYHGTPTGNLTVSSNSARNSLSTVFNGTDSKIQSYPQPSVQTISVWLKSSWASVSSGYKIPVHDYGSKLAIGFANNNRLISYVGSSAGGAGSCVLTTNKYIANQWNHIVVVKTGDTTRNVYINGELATPTTSNWWGGDLNKLTIGCRHAASRYRDYFDGQISDFRAYATALSADDVKELYQTSVSIDKDGNMFAYEFKED